LVGSNAQAHDLAIGLFMSWFPILILSSIVDRNPVASDDIRRKLNKLIDLVCISLQDPDTKSEFITSFHDMPEAKYMEHWVNSISRLAPLIKGKFFVGFAGQGRKRFHYGAAHAILLDIEKSYLADHGRGWLSQNERAARASLVLGQVDHEFVWFDGRQFWQIFSAIVLVVGTASGAFIISFFTPTVGLGCRTGGYLVFVIIAVSLLLAELIVWYITSPIRKKEVDILVQQRLQTLSDSLILESNTTVTSVATSMATFSWPLTFAEKVCLLCVLSIAKLLPVGQKKRKLKKIETAIRSRFTALQDLTVRQWVDRCFFTPLELINTIWLSYLVVAQTIGAFVNCSCQTSIWGPGGGYVDFTQWNKSNDTIVGRFWITGTIISSVFMAIGMIYVVIEWCLQSHLSTESYPEAMNGLWRVRRFRRFTNWMRYPTSAIVLTVNSLARTLKLRSTNKRKVLMWAKESPYPAQTDASFVRAVMSTHSFMSKELQETETYSKRCQSPVG
jgi:hypothetical protein